MCMHKCMHRYKFSLLLIGHLLKCRWKHSIVFEMCGSIRGELLALVSCSISSHIFTGLVILSENNGFTFRPLVCRLGFKQNQIFDLSTYNNGICYGSFM